MYEIKYIKLIDLIKQNPEHFDKIKGHYLFLLSGLTSTSYIETCLFEKNVERINEIGTIVVGVLNDL